MFIELNYHHFETPAFAGDTSMSLPLKTTEGGMR